MATRTASARWRALSRSSDRGENREQGKAGGASRRPFSVRRAIGRKRAPVGAESAPRIPPSYPPSAAAAPRRPSTLRLTTATDKIGTSAGRAKGCKHMYISQVACTFKNNKRQKLYCHT